MTALKEGRVRKGGQNLVSQITERPPDPAPLRPARQLTEEVVRQLKEVWEKMCRGEIISSNPRMHWLQRLLRWWP